MPETVIATDGRHCPFWRYEVTYHGLTVTTIGHCALRKDTACILDACPLRSGDVRVIWKNSERTDA